MENLSPMLQQYLMMKQEITSDTLLFFRLGDFYELFFQDAEIVSRELDLVLTSRAAGNNQKAPMCGVPHHAATSYIQRLVEKGYKVAIAQQMEDSANKKGLVKRAITKIITQGTNFEIDESNSARLAIVDLDLFHYYVGYYDITSNSLYYETLEKEENILLSSLRMNFVSEVLVENEHIKTWLSQMSLFPITPIVFSKGEPYHRLKQAAIQYLEYTQKQSILPDELELRESSLQLDGNTVSNLELISPLRLQSKSMTLFSYLNHTHTPMGKRKLKEWITHPLVNLKSIQKRQEAIQFLVDSFLVLSKVKALLKNIYDVERISTKIIYQTVLAQDLIRLKESLKATLQLRELLKETPLSSYLENVTVLPIVELIEKTIVDEPKTYIKDGGTIRDGVSEELDRTRALLSQGNQWLLKYEQQQKEKTGIKNLKVGYSRAFGYYIEVSKGQIGLIQESFGYMPRQTLTNAQRYISPELKQQEDEIEQAKGKVIALEQSLFDELVVSLQNDVALCQRCSKQLAELDCLTSLSHVSAQKGFVRPIFHMTNTINLRQSKHPILSETLPIHKVIANDFVLSETENMMILTGPNMGGKSTYMRQIALSIILAQMGCWVLAEVCELPLFDAIYTRMGASDDIVSGQSTFMVEMSEANFALKHATSKSLILFDELGRGTSTYDGMAIARSIIEYITETIGCKTIFSTHYHELTSLSNQYDRIVNYKVTVDHTHHHMTLLYKVVAGTSDRSYGVQVAQLAEMPTQVIQKAALYLQQYEQSHPQLQPISVIKETSKTLTLLKALDPNNMTPLEALQMLIRLKEMEQNYE